MYSPADVSSVQDFLKNTPEKSLRQMLVGKKFTEVHFQLLLKLARGCKPEEFLGHFEGEKFAQMRFSNGEIKIKEFFWPITKEALGSLGLLGDVKKKSA